MLLISALLPCFSLLFCQFLDRMTKCDVKNYLEKIYEVPVGAVRTRIQFGGCLHCNTLTFSLGHICTDSHTHLLLSKHFILRSEFVKTYEKSKHQDIC